MKLPDKVTEPELSPTLSSVWVYKHKGAKHTTEIKFPKWLCPLIKVEVNAAYARGADDARREIKAALGIRGC